MWRHNSVPVRLGGERVSESTGEPRARRELPLIERRSWRLREEPIGSWGQTDAARST